MEIRGRRLRLLLDALTAEPDQVVAFDRLVDQVWPDGRPTRPRAALRSLVRRLRLATPESITTEPTGYRLRARPAGPCQLPADLPDFVGRQREIAQLSESDAAVLALVGPPGVGKTALAVHVAHRLRARFPDGQLHVNLRGFSSGPGITAAQARARFVRALGGAPEDDYRTLLAGRRVLVLLDNATAEVLEPLLPDTPGCLAIVTSRIDLPEIAQVRLGVLGDEEAHELLAGMNVTGAPADRAELVRLCANLPLALRIAGANLAGRHLADYVDALRGANRLDALGIEGDAAVQAAFDLSYRALPDEARRLFRSLALVPGPDVPADALGAGAPIGELAAANLVQWSAPDRYQLHDLLRLYADERGVAEDEPQTREATRKRLLDWYLRMADGADAALDFGFSRLLPRVAEIHEFTGHAAALAWLDAERLNIIALALDTRSWQLVAAVRAYLLATGHHADLLVIALEALGAAQSAGASEAAAAMHSSIGFIEWRFGEHTSAMRHCARAVELYRAGGQQVQEATTLNILAGICKDIGRLDLAERHLSEAITLYRANDMTTPLCGGLGNLGLIELELGRLESAAARLASSVELARQVGAHQYVVNGLSNLAVAQSALGDFDRAEPNFHDALAHARKSGLRQIEMSTLVELAEALVARGRTTEARGYAEQALDLAVHEDRFVEADARLVLAEINRSPGEYDEALRLAEQGGFRIIEVRALAGKAALTRDLGDPRTAADLCREAIRRGELAGLRYRTDQVRSLLAACEGR